MIGKLIAGEKLGEKTFHIENWQKEKILREFAEYFNQRLIFANSYFYG